MSSQTNNNPPKFPLRFFRWFCRPDMVEDIEGDLVEQFHEYASHRGASRAKSKFLWQVMLLLRPGIIKPLFKNLKFSVMWRHNLLMSWRTIKKDKSTFLINLLGLSTGLAAALLIFLWIHDELNVDTFHANDAQLHEVMANVDLQDQIQTSEVTSNFLAEAMLTELPEVVAATFTNNDYCSPEGIFTAENQVQPATGLFAHDNFFQVLTYPLLEGIAEGVLSSENNVVLSDELAIQLFGSPTAAVGKAVRWNFVFDARTHEEILNVTGIFKSPPSNATMQFSAVVPFDLLIKADKWTSGWNSGCARTFVVLQEGTDVDLFNQKIRQFHHTKHEHLSDQELFLQQFSQKYLRGNYENGQIAGGRIAYVRFFSIIALIIILIACINFVNLSTAQASKKIKEIGVKKTMGATRRELIKQFISDSTLLTTLSFFLALALATMLIPKFNQITGKDLHLDLQPTIILPLVGILVLTAALAGAYPAFYLSGLKPLSILRGRWVASGSTQFLRKGLVVFQFAMSSLFVVGVLVVQQQIRFTQERDLGYEREHVIRFKMGNNDVDPKLLIDRIQTLPGVVLAGNTSASILKRDDRNGGYSWTGAEAEDDVIILSPRVGINTIETFRMELKAGRTFQETDQNDDSKVIINESAQTLMQLDDPIGFRLGLPPYQREIIGVVKDFQYGSLHDPMQPVILRFRRWGRYIVARIKGGTESETIPAIQEIYQELHPGYPFNYTFMDEDYQALYQSEQKVAILSKYFGILAIIISCLGLLGLSTYMTESRAREIGIRKVLGASVFSVVKLLTGQFTKTVIVGVCLAVPVGYYLLQEWLNNFAYHIDLTWSYFVFAAGLVLLVAWLVICVQTLRSATTNPVKVLSDD